MKSERRNVERARGYRAVMLTVAAVLMCVAYLAVGARPSHADSAVATVIAKDGNGLSVDHAESHKSMKKGDPAYMQDQCNTDAETVAVLEFTVGGKLGINQKSSIRIVGARSAVDVSGHVLQINAGAVWATFGKQTRPFLIRTPSTTIGIRGTEFVVDAEADATTIDVFEGRVAYVPNNTVEELPADAATAGPGSRIVIRALQAPVVKQYDAEQLRKEDAERFKELADTLLALHIIRDVAGYIPGLGNVAHGAALAADVIENPAQAAVNYAASHVPGGGIIGGMFGGGGGKKKEPDFIVELKPSEGPANPSDLQFSWKQFKDAKQYVLLMGREEKMEKGNLDWTTQVKETSVAYPKNAPALQAGQKYFWRVVATDEGGKPKGKASQSWFTVPADYKPSDGGQPSGGGH